MELLVSKAGVRLPSDGAWLFRGVSLKAAPGERILLEGRSGVGKTTLLHLMGGLLTPDEGRVSWDGRDVGSLPASERARLRRSGVSIVYQRLNLLDHLTARENVELGLPDPPGDAAARALETVGLGGIAERRASVLSLGEQQRVAVARAIASRPRLILSDEPTSSLDSANAALVLDALERAAEASGAAWVMVSHDLRVRERFARRHAFEELVSR